MGTYIFLGVLGAMVLTLVILLLVSATKGKKKKTLAEERQEEKPAPVEEKPKPRIKPIGNGEEKCALRLKNIVKVYGEGDSKVKALRGVCLSFRKNEFVSVLGPSGCGKTTMLNIVGGLDRYTSGNLLINGISTKKYRDSDWDTYRNNSVGFVFQNYNLIPHQTILNNVELALTLSGVSKTERKKRAKAVLEKVGLKGLESKRPNQLSGGQMQRVAIARALVNNPEIILADEPTGALDTETSIQIMELLKEVAKDRLVIMVTHNPELAEKYSTRIIRLIDGQVTGDSNPFKGSAAPTEVGEKKGRAQMGFGTALALSLSNLRTKKGRTILTSIAGSIGIIGIALVLAVSTGFSAYINKLQADTLSVYPLTITEAVIDLEDFEKITEGTGLEKFPKLEEVYEQEMFKNLANMLKSNKISDEYYNYVLNHVNAENQKAEQTDEKWKYCLQESYGFDMNDYLYADVDFLGQDFTMPVNKLVQYLSNMFDGGMASTGMGISASFVRSYIPTMSEMPANDNLIHSQYDLLKGDWATEEDELLLVVDASNQVTDVSLAFLGFNSIDGINMDDYSVQFGQKSVYNFDEIIGKEFYYLKNDSRFSANPMQADSFIDATYISKTNIMTRGQFNPDMTLKITGIVRIKEDVQQGVLNNGLAYTQKLTRKVLADNMSSSIVESVKNTQGGKVTINSWFMTPLAMNHEYTARQLAGDNTISKLSIYSVGYEAKEEMKTYLDGWNNKEGRLEEEKVHYSDSTAMLFSAMNTIVDAVKIVLICFTAISLVVSSIMIGIITYVSVVERTKEIGVLRSIGARKKDISRIFNAETFLIGLFAGLIGVAATYLLCIPINLIIGHFLVGVGNLAALKITDALVLVAVSFVLTLIAGIFPARIAAKKDPVVALRSE